MMYFSRLPSRLLTRRLLMSGLLAGCILAGPVFAGVLAAQTVGPVPATWAAPSKLDSTAELQQLMHVTETGLPLEKYDLIKINVYAADALSERVRIAPDGTVEIPLAGAVTLAGLSIARAQQLIADRIVERGLVLIPDVTIDVLESPAHVIAIDGQVKTPGSYPALGDTQISAVGASVGGVRTLGQLLSVAGGLLPTASDVITLTRPSLPGPVSIPLGNDPNQQPYAQLPLFAGDQIQVPHCGQAYVIGAVKKQGIIPLKNYSPTTVSQAVAISDGVGYEASANDARLVRTQGTQRIVYRVKVRRIIEGRDPDVALQNDDILYIPTNQARAALKSGAAGLIVSLASTYIYAHP